MTLPETVAGFSEDPTHALEPLWLSEEEVVALHEKQLRRFGGPSGVRDPGALGSAIDRARNKWAYGENDMSALASANAYRLARNHPFVDGNKRAAFVAMMLILRKNGVPFAPPPAA
jgi:death-on-curing protein